MYLCSSPCRLLITDYVISSSTVYWLRHFLLLFHRPDSPSNRKSPSADWLMFFLPWIHLQPDNNVLFYNFITSFAYNMFMLQAWCWLLFHLSKKKMVLLRNKFLTVKYRIQIFPLKDNDCVFGICACRLHPTLCDTRQQFYLTGISSSEFTYICTCLWFCILIMGL